MGQVLCSQEIRCTNKTAGSSSDIEIGGDLRCVSGRVVAERESHIRVSHSLRHQRHKIPDHVLPHSPVTSSHLLCVWVPASDIPLLPLFQLLLILGEVLGKVLPRSSSSRVKLRLIFAFELF